MQAEDMRPVRGGKKLPSSSQSPSFLEKLFSFFFGSNDPEKEKKRLLKEIEHQLKSVKHRFYRPKTEEVLPTMAKFFHEIYSITGPAQLIVGHAETSDVLKTMVIEHAFDDQLRSLRESLTEDGIKSRADELGLEKLDADIKGRVNEFLASFDSQRAKSINLSYNLMMTFLDVIRFDYYFLLKKFDPRLPEQDFRYIPRFDSLQAEYVIDDLKDFLTLIYTVDLSADWRAVLAILKEYRAADVVNAGDWNRIMKMFTDVRRSQVFELCVRHAEKNPLFKVKIVPHGAHVVEDYLAKVKTQAELTVQKLIKRGHEETIEKYTVSVFGTTSVARTKNYTEKNNALFAQRMLGGFIHIAPINFLYAFLVDYFSKDIRDLVDLLIVRGRWATPLLSQQLSESFHVLLQAADEVVEFDESLAEEAEVGMRIRSLAWKADRDRSAVKTLRQAVNELNDQALGLLQRSARNLVIMGKSLKIVLEEYDRKGRELLTNWKEIETVSNGTVRSKIVNVYKKIYYFVQLIQLYAKKEKEE